MPGTSPRNTNPGPKIKGQPRKDSLKKAGSSSRMVHQAEQGQNSYRDLACLLVITALIWGTHALWLSMDSRPPVWDMAIHQSYALNYLQAPGDDRAAMSFWSMSGHYPPFVHLLIALVWSISRPDSELATLANLPATILLLWAVYRLGSELAGRTAGLWASSITALTPYLIWMSRETILDYWLSTWVAVGLVALRRTDGFCERYRSLFFGFVLALGLLTKWLFAAFLFFPLLQVVIQVRVWRDVERLKNLVRALVTAAVLSGIWYIPNLANLLQFFRQNAAVGALEGEPPILSWQSLIYYLRLLEGYQMFALLFALLTASCVVVWKRGLVRDLGFLVATVFGAWLILTALRTKDPRFTMPLLGPLAIVSGAWIQSWGITRRARAAKALLLAALFFQAYAINFGVSWLPEEIVLAEGYRGSLRWDWNLYLQHYFNILGKPRLENWKQSEILNRVEQDSLQNALRPSLGIVPDLPRFNAANFALTARLMRLPVPVSRLILTPTGLFPLDALDYVIISDGDQGMSWTTQTNAALNQIVRESPTFRFLAEYPLPNGSQARLYSVRHDLSTSPR